MARERRTRTGISLRAMLAMFAASIAVYVGAFSGIVAFRMERAAGAMYDFSHTAVALALTRNRLDTTMERTSERLRRVLLEAEGGAPEASEMQTLATTARSFGDSAWVMQASGALARSTIEERVTLAEAMGAESQSIMALAEAVSHLEAGRTELAWRAVHRSDSMRHVATGRLFQIERDAFFAGFESERTVGALVESAKDIVVWWGAGGFLLLGTFGWLVHRRVYRPLSELDAGLGRVAVGDLAVRLPVRFQDEVGRLKQHFNEMSDVIADRSAEDQRRAENLAARLGRVLEDSWSEFFVFNAETLRFQQVNRGARLNLGFTDDQFAARTVFELLPDYDERSFVKLLQPLRDGESPHVEINTRLRRADGTTYPVEMTIQLSTREEPPVFVAMVQDVTERRRLEEERTRIFEQSVDLQFESRLNGELTRINRAWERTLGFPRETLVGRVLADLADPGDSETARGLIDGLARGRAIRGVTLRLRGRDGDSRWISWNCDPPANGTIYGIGRDVTAQVTLDRKEKTLRVALERSAREWQWTFDSIGDPVLILTASGGIVRLNEAAKRVAGGSKDDPVGRPLREWADGPLFARAEALARQVASEGRTVSSQVGGSGSGPTWDVEATPLAHGPEGGATVIVIAHDVTPIAQLQQSLRRSETMAVMGTLVAGVAHEVRNPLFSMSATLDAFEARQPAPGAAEPHIGILRSQLERLTKLMRDLLEYGKPPTLELGSVDLSVVIGQAFDACGSTARAATVSLESVIEPGLPAVHADAGRLVQVFVNLCTNAIQHSPCGGTVSISAHAVRIDGRSWVDCEISDEGPGFAEADLPYVFQPFYTRRVGGTGLGLPIVHRIVTQHGGTITAENGDPGGVVRLRLPVFRG